VHIDTLAPVQHRADRNFRIATNVRIQRMLKHPHISEFHSLAEYFYAGLLEGTPAVSVYVPQPFSLRVGKRRYKPDFYVLERDRRRVVELKPRGEFSEALWQPLDAFFAAHGMHFEVISNEEVFSRKIEAQNWLEVVRALNLCRDLDTQVAESSVLDQCQGAGTLTLGDLIDPGDRDRTLETEIALFRLLHRGHLSANLSNRPLDYATSVQLA
jgi:hypothetical protein